MKKLVLALGLFLTIGSLYAFNPFEDLAKGDYVGYYTSSQMTMIIGEDNGVFEGTVNRDGQDYSFSGSLNAGSLKGSFGDSKKFPFSAKLDGNELSFKSGGFKDTMTKKQGEFKSGEFKSDKVYLKLEDDGNGSFSGVLKINGKIYSVRGKASGGLFYGKFMVGNTKYSFTLLNDKFSSAGFNSDLERIVKLESDSYLSSLTHDGKYYYENSIGMELAYVAPGTFNLGSNSGENDDILVHKVAITKPYLIGKYEVTQSEYQKIMGTNPTFRKGSNNPVGSVSWNDAVDFCRKLTSRERSNGNLKSGYVYRLPTEAEWEFAAKGGNMSKGYEYSGSNSINSVAWYRENSGEIPHSVGQKSSNELGLYDMSGNVEEWCQDWYGDYSFGFQIDPTGASSGSKRVTRGGSCCYPDYFCLLTDRTYHSPGDSSGLVGFRVVLVKE